VRRPVIEVRNVGKCYRRPIGGSGGSLRRLGDFFARTPHWALHDVSLTVCEGEALGIIGTNGAGKSTLLRMMSGLTPPTRGTVQLHDRVSGLLTLGENFQPLLTAEENALTAAILAGLGRREARARMPAIADFAELAHVMDQPLRTFSDGMKLRLAFAVSINVTPRVLLIDEVLAVGDLRFRQKCIDRLTELHREEQVTLILTSHELEQVEALCTRAIWLSGGVVAAEGPPDEVTAAYRRSQQPAVAETALGEGGFLRQGNRHVEISAVRIGTGPSGGTTLTTGHPMTVDFDLSPREPVEDVAISISATDADGTLCFDMSSVLDAVSLGPLKAEQSVRLELHRLDLTPGEYSLEIGVYSPDYSVAFDVHSGAYHFEVVGPRAKGVVNPPRTWRVT
jgi:homopolymeric O-antigen transport system ATP-binding protein